jgi:hypothetical protein
MRARFLTKHDRHRGVPQGVRHKTAFTHQMTAVEGVRRCGTSAAVKTLAEPQETEQLNEGSGSGRQGQQHNDVGENNTHESKNVQAS